MNTLYIKRSSPYFSWQERWGLQNLSKNWVPGEGKRGGEGDKYCGEGSDLLGVESGDERAVENHSPEQDSAPTPAHPVRLGLGAQLCPRALSAAHPRQHGPSWCADPSARRDLGSALKQGVLSSSKWIEEQRKIPIMETLEHQRTLLIRRLQLLLKGGPRTVFWTVGREE